MRTPAAARAASVSRALKAAGLVMSTSSAARWVRGTHLRRAGLEVTERRTSVFVHGRDWSAPVGVVDVRYHGYGGIRSEDQRERDARVGVEVLERAEEVLRSKGFEVVREGGALVVSRVGSDGEVVRPAELRFVAEVRAERGLAPNW